MKKLQMYERYVSIQLIAQGILTLLSFQKSRRNKSGNTGFLSLCYARTLREDTAPSEAMTQKALRGAVRYFPRVLKTLKSTANLGEIAEQELLVPMDLKTKKSKNQS